MSNGSGQDGGVMNNQTTTFPWHNSQLVRTQPRRISFSLHSERNHKRIFEDQRIITGIQFGKSDSLASKQYSTKLSYLRSRQTEKETEPVWVSVLGGIGVALGFIACWVLI